MLKNVLVHDFLFAFKHYKVRKVKALFCHSLKKPAQCLICREKIILLQAFSASDIGPSEKNH